ncbi:MAG: hypothetical protein ACTSV7_00535 [Candidatus Baldrarchaeia archaeon]
MNLYGKAIKEPQKILEDAYNKAVGEFQKDKGKSFLSNLNAKARNWLTIIAKNCEKQKAVVSALITSLTKKLENPSQDVRYHKVELPGGYSGRTFDTRYVTPFLKKKFPRIAMKESAWLTRSIEQPHAFTLRPRFPGKIQNKQVKEAFLQLLEDIEVNKADPMRYLVAMFILLTQEASKVQTTISSIPRVPAVKEIEIDLIINCLKSHFFAHYSSHGASKLPVIAIYSIYKIMVKELNRYHDKKLEPLMSHVSPDMRSGRIGDIEVRDKNNECFEAVEVKYGIPIDSVMVKDAYKKFSSTRVRRYYLLTTAKPYIKQGEEWNIKSLKRQIRKDHGCEVIVNGIMQSIKYYLRLLRSPTQFINVYTETLKLDAAKTAELKKEHIQKWSEIINRLTR